MMKPPRYGTVPTDQLPLLQVNEGVAVRVLAGEYDSHKGPFETVQPVQMLDFEVSPGGFLSLDVIEGLDTSIVYVYEGPLTVNDQSAAEGSVVLLDASLPGASHRGISLSADADCGKALLFAGNKLKEPIAWHGPIVMNTQEQLPETFPSELIGTTNVLRPSPKNNKEITRFTTKKPTDRLHSMP